MTGHPTSIRLDPRLLGAVDSTAVYLGMKRSALLVWCIRLGLAEVIKGEAVIAHAGRDYKTTSIGGVNVVDVDYPELEGGKG